jgi:hypothetical protein
VVRDAGTCRCAKVPINLGQSLQVFVIFPDPGPTD